MAGFSIPCTVADPKTGEAMEETLRIQSDAGGGWQYGLLKTRKSGDRAGEEYIANPSFGGHCLHAVLMSARKAYLVQSDAEGIPELLAALRRFDNEVSPLLTISAQVHLEGP